MYYEGNSLETPIGNLAPQRTSEDVITWSLKIKFKGER